MSVMFKIIPKDKKIALKIKKMKLKDFLDNLENKYDYMFFDDEFLNENIEDYIIHLGIELYTSRGFEFNIEDDMLYIRVN